jgi:hypothetical protein
MFQLEYFNIPRSWFAGVIAGANRQPDYWNHKVLGLPSDEPNQLICPVSVISSFQEHSRRGCFISLREIRYLFLAT